MRARLAQSVGYPNESYTEKTALSRLVRQLHEPYVEGTDSNTLNAFVQGCVKICASHNIEGSYAKTSYILCALLYDQNFIKDPLHGTLSACFSCANSDIELQNMLTTLLSNFNEESHAAG
jgi:hypothetical protein